MLLVLKSSPDTVEGKRGINLARDMAADIILVQNGVYFAQKEMLEGFCGAAYALDEDISLRGLRDDELEDGIKKIGYAEMVDLMANEDKVVGIF